MPRWCSHAYTCSAYFPGHGIYETAWAVLRGSVACGSQG